MNCFNHPDAPAVGICMSCCKGLCPDCAAVLERGLACKNACEDRVKLLHRIIDNNARIIASANSQMRSSGFFVLILGICLCLFGLWPFVRGGDTSGMFMVVIGILFVIFGIMPLLKKWMHPTAK